MCGIAGFCLNPETDVNANKLARTLLLNIEHRGRDATGAAWLNSRDMYNVQKRDVKATDLVRVLSVDKSAKTAILHTRFATQGHESNNANNHPIPVGDIIGVHNGCISNDWSLFKYDIGEDKRIAEVDSEAIFSLLNYGIVPDPQTGKTSSGKETIPDALELIHGSAAIAWLDRSDRSNTLHMARLQSSPLVLGLTMDDSFVFASEEAAVKSGIESVGLEVKEIIHCKPGTYFVVRDGLITEVESFEPHTYAYTGNYSRTSGYRPTPAWENTFDKEWGEDYCNRSTTQVMDYDEEDISDYLERKFTADTVSDPIVQSMNVPYLDPKLLNPVDQIELTETKTYASLYWRREKAIEDWFSGLKADDGDTLGLWYSTGADLRPGDWVTTDVMGVPVFGQVYKLPNTFPEGAYILRVYIPNSERSENYETSFITRNIGQFDISDSGASAVDGIIHEQLDALADLAERGQDYDEETENLVEEVTADVQENDEQTIVEAIMEHTGEVSRQGILDYVDSEGRTVGDTIWLGGILYEMTAPGCWEVAKDETLGVLALPAPQFVATS